MGESDLIRRIEALERQIRQLEERLNQIEATAGRALQNTGQIRNAAGGS